MNLRKYCAFDKYDKVKFNKIAVHKNIAKLDYVDSDLWVPCRVPSKSGVTYFMTLIDDYS